MTLATYNRYVDNATGANRIERWSEQHGRAADGDPVLYWKEDLKKMGRHSAPKPRVSFFLSALFIPRKILPLQNRIKLFGAWFR